jgi:imidazolonepropionase-like amidohydrolase
VDTIEHGWPLADDVIESMRERGTILVPTISVYSERGFLRDEVQQPLFERAENQLPIRADSVRRAFEAGVKIACGTDITPSMPTMTHGENAFELQALVRAGVEPIDAIRAATGVAAEALGVLDELGTVSEGKRADAVLVSRDPEADVSALEQAVTFVVKDGTVVVAP